MPACTHLRQLHKVVPRTNGCEKVFEDWRHLDDIFVVYPAVTSAVATRLRTSTPRGISMTLIIR